MLKISHEIPIAMLKKSRSFNDYEYALCHLFNEREDYRDFYIESVKKERHVLLDNSIFELGTAFDSNEYAKIINELNPTEYIVPDVTDDMEGTISSFKKWKEDFANECPGKMMGVVHGKTYEEIKECLKFLSNNCFRIAFNFQDNYYSETGIGNNVYERMMDGRCRLFEKLESDLALPRNKSYHLLGASLPQECLYAGKFNYVKHIFTSLDTSNPIVHGINGIRYRGENGIDGLETKESIKLADLIDHVPTKKQLIDIAYNVKAFRNIVSQSDYNHETKIYEHENCN
jgi:hypothetical protein